MIWLFVAVVFILAALLAPPFRSRLAQGVACLVLAAFSAWFAMHTTGAFLVGVGAVGAVAWVGCAILTSFRGQKF